MKAPEVNAIGNQAPRVVDNQFLADNRLIDFDKPDSVAVEGVRGRVDLAQRLAAHVAGGHFFSTRRRFGQLVDKGVVEHLRARKVGDVHCINFARPWRPTGFGTRRRHADLIHEIGDIGA